MESSLTNRGRNEISIEIPWCYSSSLAKTTVFNSFIKVCNDGYILLKVHWGKNLWLCPSILNVYKLNMPKMSNLYSTSVDFQIHEFLKLASRIVPARSRSRYFVNIGFFVKVIDCIFNQVFTRRVDEKWRSETAPLVNVIIEKLNFEHFATFSEKMSSNLEFKFYFFSCHFTVVKSRLMNCFVFYCQNVQIHLLKFHDQL